MESLTVTSGKMENSTTVYNVSAPCQATKDVAW